MMQCLDSAVPFRKRRGASILEAMVSLVLLAAISTILVHTLALLTAQQRTVRQQTLAREEAANLMERVFALHWEQLTEEEFSNWELSPELLSAHSQAELRITVESPESREAPLSAKRIRIVVSLPRPNQQAGEAVQLVAWRYEGDEGA